MNTIPPVPSAVSPVLSCVLIVEGDQALRGLIAEIVQERCSGEVRAVFASSVKEACAILEKLEVDLVITCYDLPDGDGGHVLEKAIEMNPTAVRAFASGRNIPPADQSLAHAVIPKPWSLHAFTAFLKGGYKAFSPAART